MSPTTKGRKKQKARTQAVKMQETFRKRKGGLYKKGHELASFTETNVYVVISRGGQDFIYNSSQRADWPPGKEYLESSLSVAERRSPADFSAISFPARRKRKDSKDIRPDILKSGTSSKTIDVVENGLSKPADEMQYVTYMGGNESPTASEESQSSWASNFQRRLAASLGSKYIWGAKNGTRDCNIGQKAKVQLPTVPKMPEICKT